MKYLIGQRVIVNGEIGTIHPSPKPGSHGMTYPNDDVRGYWVQRPSMGYASYYDPKNVQALPGGQL